MIRRPNLEDIETLSRIHVQAWDEAYRGLLPDSEIAARDLTFRRALWPKLITNPDLRIAYAPNVGFAVMGQQRDAPLAAQEYHEELSSLYVLKTKQGRGIGRALLAAVARQQAFTALMVSGNQRAGAFYLASGAVLLDQREVTEGDLTFQEDVYGWSSEQASAIVA